MKKFLALSMASLLVLSSAVVAFGAELSSAMGGRFYGYFSSIDGDQGFNPGAGNDCWDTILATTLKGENGTWARISFIASTWEQKINHAFGIDNIAGSAFSLGFDTHDTGTTNLGQQFMGDLFNDFKADPFFNSCNMGGSFNYKYVTDTFEYRGEAKVYDGDGSTKGDTADDHIYANAIILKTEVGKFYVGNQHKVHYDDMFVVGFDGKISDLGLKVDFWSDKEAAHRGGEFANAFWGEKGGHQTLQATLNFNRLTGQVMYSKPELDQLDDVYGVGLEYQLTKNLALGAKLFMVDDTNQYNKEVKSVKDGKITEYGTETTDQYYDVYGDYTVGAWGIKAGVSNAQYMYGQGGKYNIGATEGADNSACYSNDPFFYAGVHFSF